MSLACSPRSPNSTLASKVFASIGGNAVWHGCAFSDHCRPDTDAIDRFLDGLSAASALRNVSARTNLSENVLLSEAREALQDPSIEPPAFPTQRHVQVLVPEAWKEWDFCDWDGDGHFDMTRFAKAGLPTLGQAIAFTKILDVAADSSCFVIILSSTERRAAGAVLAGAALVLSQGFSSEAAWSELVQAGPAPSSDPAKSWHRFPQPFTKIGVPTATSVSVLDCLTGLQFARDRGWFGSAGYCAFAVKDWRALRRKFDASWVIPGEVLAMASPWETAQNPTFPGLLDPYVHDGNFVPVPPSRASEPRYLSMDAPSTLVSSRPESCSETPRSRSMSDGCMQFSVCSDIDELAEMVAERRNEIDQFEHKKYNEEYSEDPSLRLALLGLDNVDDELRENHAADVKHPLPIAGLHVIGRHEPASASTGGFAGYFYRENISRLVRLNYMCESPHQDGYIKPLNEVGVEVLDFAFNDGDIPSKRLIEKVFVACEKARKDNCRIAIHCMAGLGRTGVMVGAYAVARHDMPGTAFHGWIRMCRPGSVQTACQEKFLRALKPRPSSKRATRSRGMSELSNSLLKKATSWGSSLSFLSQKSA